MININVKLNKLFMISADYIFARHCVRVEGLRLVNAFNRMRGFNLFYTDREGDPICRFIGNDSESFPVVEEEIKILYKDSKDGFKSFFAKKKDGGFIFDSSSEKGDRVVFVTNDNIKEVTFYGDYSDDLLRFALWLAYGLAVLPTLTVSLHASSIVYNNKVVLFLGESGTGKSTHSRLWLQNIKGAELFNDDSPILRVENGEIIAYGGPWSGKTPCYRTESYPLAACIRLSQAPHNKISRLSTVAAYTALHPSCPPEFAYDENLYDHVSEFLSHLVSSVPVFRMEALPDAEAAKVSCEAVFGSCLKN